MELLSVYVALISVSSDLIAKMFGINNVPDYIYIAIKFIGLVACIFLIFSQYKKYFYRASSIDDD